MPAGGGAAGVSPRLAARYRPAQLHGQPSPMQASPVQPGPVQAGPAQGGRVPAAPAPRSAPAGLSEVAALSMTFADFGVPAPLVSVLTGTGILTPFPIQAATLPDALAGLDILGRGRTGSGKTLGFAIPLVAGLADGHTLACHPRGLVLVPTRELASQVHAVIAPLAAAMNLTVTTIFGGIGQNAQVTALRNRVDIVVACPGRLADLIEQGHCHLGDVEISVVDEADHMADLGFLPVVRRLMEATPPEGQRMLFSATLDKAVDVLVRRFLSDPAVHSVDSAAAAPAAMVHHLLTVSPGDRVRRGRRAGGRRQPVAGLHPHQARRAEAHPSAGRGRGSRGRTARQPEAGGPGAEPGVLRLWRRPGSGRHGHRGPRYPRGRHRPGDPR